MRGRIKYQLANNINNKFVNVLKVRSFLWTISLFMEMREQLGKMRILLNQPNICLCKKEDLKYREGNLLSDTCIWEAFDSQIRKGVFFSLIQLMQTKWPLCITVSIGIFFLVFVGLILWCCLGAVAENSVVTTVMILNGSGCVCVCKRWENQSFPWKRKKLVISISLSSPLHQHLLIPLWSSNKIKKHGPIVYKQNDLNSTGNFHFVNTPLSPRIALLQALCCVWTLQSLPLRAWTLDLL